MMPINQLIITTRTSIMDTAEILHGYPQGSSYFMCTNGKVHFVLWTFKWCALLTYTAVVIIQQKTRNEFPITAKDKNIADTGIENFDLLFKHNSTTWRIHHAKCNSGANIIDKTVLSVRHLRSNPTIQSIIKCIKIFRAEQNTWEHKECPYI